MDVPQRKPSVFSWRNARLALILLGVLVAVVGTAYALGLTQGRSEMDRQRAAYEERLQRAQSEAAEQRATLEQQIEAARSEAAQLRAQLARVEAVNQLLMARGLLYQAAVELDRRNFGLANDAVQSARAALQLVDAGAAGLDAARLQELQQRLANTNVVVATDLESQRDLLLDLAREMDRLVPH